MRKREDLGKGQWEVLTYVTNHAPVTVAQVAEAFAQSHGLARTTVLTVMERLRAKGYLTRAKSKEDGRSAVYEYAPSVSKTQLMRDAVSQFVETTMGGSFAPFLAYLAQETEVSDEQLRELKSLVRELESGNRSKTHPSSDEGIKGAHHE